MLVTPKSLTDLPDLTAPEAPAVPPPRWQRRPEARPEEILTAALTVFGRAGYAGARLSDIAARAGISKAALYRYFDSKAALFREMVRTLARTSLDPESAAAGFFPDTAEKKLLRLVREVWAALCRPELASLTRLVHAEQARFPELGRFYFDEVVLRIRARLARVLEAGRARGEFRPPVHAVALHLLPSFLLHQALLREGLRELDPDRLGDDQLVTGAVELLLHGIVRRGTRTDAE